MNLLNTAAIIQRNPFVKIYVHSKDIYFTRTTVLSFSKQKRAIHRQHRLFDWFALLNFTVKNSFSFSSVAL